MDNNVLELIEAAKKALKRLKELQDATGYPTALPQIELEAAIKKNEVV